MYTYIYMCVKLNIYIYMIEYNIYVCTYIYICIYIYIQVIPTQMPRHCA